MSFKLIKALGLSYFLTMLAGMCSASCILILTGAGVFLGVVLVSGVLALFLPFLECIFLLLPLGIIESERVQLMKLRPLLERYMPWIVLPAGFLFVYILFFLQEEPLIVNGSLIVVMNHAALSFLGLYLFLKRLKSN